METLEEISIIRKHKWAGISIRPHNASRWGTEKCHGAEDGVRGEAGRGSRPRVTALPWDCYNGGHLILASAKGLNVGLMALLQLGGKKKQVNCGRTRKVNTPLTRPRMTVHGHLARTGHGKSPASPHRTAHPHRTMASSSWAWREAPRTDAAHPWAGHPQNSSALCPRGKQTGLISPSVG